MRILNLLPGAFGLLTVVVVSRLLRASGVSWWVTVPVTLLVSVIVGAIVVFLIGFLKSLLKIDDETPR